VISIFLAKVVTPGVADRVIAVSVARRIPDDVRKTPTNVPMSRSAVSLPEDAEPLGLDAQGDVELAAGVVDQRNPRYLRAALCRMWQITA
jgi:hypothetical protein